MSSSFDEKSSAVLEALSLNDKQKEAVLVNDRPLLILAGAGSGKTRTIISKIVYDILVLDIDPHNILAVTFTNKAAEEMRTRLTLYLGENRAKNVEIRTFHSFGANFLRLHANVIGLNPAFAIYDDKDALALLKTKYTDTPSKDLKPIIEKILEAKERGFNVNNYMEYFDSHTDIYEYFKVYDKLLRESGNVDLPELISLPTKALSSNPELRQETQLRYQRIFVDEYQDTNGAQFALLKCLVGSGNIICVVGDDDQSIYSFRGSEVEHILEFTDYFKGAATVKLEENYRSSGSIIALASSLIKHNKQRHDKTLWTGNPKGDLPRLVVFDTERDEAAFIASELKNSDENESVAVLYRTNAQGASFEDAFLNKRILYHVLRGNSFYERADIKDVVALMALVLNSYDVVAFLRIANKPARALGDTAQNTILDFASLYCSGDLIEALKTVKLTKKATEGAVELALTIERARTRLGKEPNSDFLRTLLMESGLYAYYAAVDEKEGNTTDLHIDALEALCGQVDSFETGENGIIALMEQMSLVSAQDTKTTEGVALSTVHGVKGLEFDRVYITGLEDGLFPLTRSDSTEEERRLMYVAITRARKNLTLTLSLSRFKYGKRENQKPSPYIKELDKQNYTLHNNSLKTNDQIVARLFNKNTEDSSYDDNRSSYNRYGYQNRNLYQNSKKPYNSYSSSNNQSAPEILARLKKASELENSGDYQKMPTSREVGTMEAESLPFKTLDRVEHPDPSYGKGRIARIRMLKDRYVMDVHFDNGRDSVFPVFNTKLRKI